MFQTLRDNIVSGLEAHFPDHTHLPFGIEIDRNRNGDAAKSFSVLIQDSTGTDQLVGRSVLDVTIEVNFSDRYTANRNNDSSQQTVSLSLADRCLEAFEYLANSKLNNSSGVRLATLREISEANFLDDEKTIIRTLTLTANIRV